MYLLDTNTISNLFKKGQISEQIKENFKNKLKVHKKLKLFTSVICYQEILRGIKDGESKHGKDYKREAFEKEIEFLNKELQIIDYTVSKANRFAQITSKLNRLGKPVKEYDIMIAATAIEADLILVTSDGDFKNIPNLVVEDWTKPL